MPGPEQAMDALALIHRLRQHQIWANHRLLDAARPLTNEQLHHAFPIGRGSVWATLVHLYGAERTWLEAMQGYATPATPEATAVDAFDALETAWQALEQRWQDFLAHLTEQDLDRPVRKTTSAGRTHATPLVDVILHVTTHAQYTAAQAKNMLRQLGVTPLPDVMLITLSRESGKGDG